MLAYLKNQATAAHLHPWELLAKASTEKRKKEESPIAV
jgi:hypothetical protein